MCVACTAVFIKKNSVNIRYSCCSSQASSLSCILSKENVCVCVCSFERKIPPQERWTHVLILSLLIFNHRKESECERKALTATRLTRSRFDRFIREWVSRKLKLLHSKHHNFFCCITHSHFCCYLVITCLLLAALLLTRFCIENDCYIKTSPFAGFMD